MKLKAKGFAGIKEIDVDFDKPLCLIVGENETGKTSVVDSMRLACSQEVRGIASGDRAVLSNDGGKFSVKFYPNEESELTATAKTKPSKAVVKAALGISTKALEYCLNPNLLIRAIPAKRKELFAEVLQLEFDWRTIAIEKYKCDERVVKSLSKDPREATKEAEAGRRMCKKVDLPTKPVDFEVKLKAGPTAASEVPLEDLLTALATIEEALSDALTEKGTLLAGVMSPGKREEIEAEVAKIEKKLEDAVDTEALVKEKAEAAEELGKAKTEYAEISAEQKGIELLSEKLADILGKLCEKCKKAVGLGGDSAENIEKLETERAELTESITLYTNEIADLQEKIDAADVNGLPEKLAQLKASLEQGSDDSAVQEQEKLIEKLSAKIDGGRKLRDQVVGYRKDAEAYKSEVSRVEDLAAQRDKWDKVVKTIPEIEKEAVSSGLTPLREILDGFTFLEKNIDVSEDMEISYDGRPASLMSDSAQYRLGLILNFAVLKLFGAKFAIVDRADTIVSPSVKKLFLRDLLAISKEMQIILFQAQADSKTEEMVKRGLPEEIALFQMKDGGMVRRV